MAEKNPEIKTIEACGVKVDIDLSNFADVRVAVAMAHVSDDTLAQGEKLIWYSRALDVIFGGDTYRIQTDLANANGGKLTEDVFSEFFKAVMESGGESKN